MPKGVGYKGTRVSSNVKRGSRNKTKTKTIFKDLGQAKRTGQKSPGAGPTTTNFRSLK